MIYRDFSGESKEVIKMSREVALELGYNYISTTHFFIADCRLDSKGSIKNFAFKNDEGMEAFIKAVYSPDPVTINESSNDSLFLTKEAVITIRQSVLLCYLFGGKEVLPCHIFLAAIKNQETLMWECFSHHKEVYETLLKYYTDSGIIDPSAGGGVIRKMIQKIPFKILRLFRVL